ncbi:MAG: transporter substrate-binding domain-containing protein, partial [Anaerolineae bacterium]|nr:transporter substrate-binding domain-containing protein [Anaerolineae bacterium]
RYTVSYFDAGQVIVRPPGSGFATLYDLDGHALAVEFGTEGDLEARAWQRRLHELDIVPFNAVAEALDAVLAGEADAALVDAVAARLWLRAHERLELAPEYVTHDAYAVAVQAENERLWQAINEALLALIEDGTVDDILARWL